MTLKKCWSDSLVREIVLVLLLKLVMLYGLWLAFFQDPVREEALGAALDHALLGHSVASPRAPSDRGRLP